MSEASELIAQQILNASVNKRTWGELVYNVKSVGGVGDGLTDDTAAIQDTIELASADGGVVAFSPGTYLTGSFTVPSNVTLWFSNGADLSIRTGETVTINGPIDAGLYQIFSGLGTVSGLSRTIEVLPEWWGAVGDGTTNDSASIQKCIDTASVIKFRPVQYKIGTKINIPQSKVLNIIGTGLKKTEFVVAAGITGFQYARAVSTVGSVVKFINIVFVESGLGKTSYGIDFQGYSAAVSDNWLRLEDCYLYGFDRAINLGNCGQCYFTRVYSQLNRTVFFLNRAASFIYFDGCMSLGNQTTIYADDALADGISNGIFIQNCNSVTCTDLDYRILGWQGVYIIGGGGCDLGSGGTAAVYIGSCQDVVIENMYVSSDPSVSSTRYAIWIQNSHTLKISGNSIVNSKMGILIEGVNGVGTKAVIEANKFDGNALNDVFLSTYVTSSKVTSNHFMSVVSRTGSNYDIYANTAGADYNFITLNTFKGASYSIVTGVNSVTTNNIFSAVG